MNGNNVKNATSRLPGFYNLTVHERREMLKEKLALDDDTVERLASGLATEIADLMVENVVGVFGLPLGLAPNFVVDGEPVIVPMAVEEPSVVAACSHVAKVIGEHGGFFTESTESLMVGQIQMISVATIESAQETIALHKEALLEKANAFCPGLVRRGGGCRDVYWRTLDPLPSTHPHYVPDEAPMGVVHFVIDCLDAMGANVVNTIVEGVARELELLLEGKALLRILSNLCDERLAKASFQLPVAALKTPHATGLEVAEGVVAAYRFAARDPYRAATHNKGIMNGVDAVAIATGNDWRAVESGAHAYAARAGRYSSMSKYWIEEDILHGELELPLAVGTVGGSTQTHPSVVAARTLIGEQGLSSSRLSRLMMAVGLAQNFAALKALVTEGIQKGHMRLHARQVALAVGASEAEVDSLTQCMREESNFQPAFAQKALARLRKEHKQQEAQDSVA